MQRGEHVETRLQRLLLWTGHALLVHFTIEETQSAPLSCGSSRFGSRPGAKPLIVKWFGRSYVCFGCRHLPHTPGWFRAMHGR